MRVERVSEGAGRGAWCGGAGGGGACAQWSVVFADSHVSLPRGRCCCHNMLLSKMMTPHGFSSNMLCQLTTDLPTNVSGFTVHLRVSAALKVAFADSCVSPAGAWERCGCHGMWVLQESLLRFPPVTRVVSTRNQPPGDTRCTGAEAPHTQDASSICCKLACVYSVRCIQMQLMHYQQAQRCLTSHGAATGALPLAWRPVPSCV